MLPFSFGPRNEVNKVRYPGSLYLVVFDNLRWISYGCRFYIDFKNVIAALAMCHDRLKSSVCFIRTEDPCMQFKMAAASLMPGFSRWQFVVLERKTQVFNAINQKNNF